jgi:hypothetical protein
MIGIRSNFNNSATGVSFNDSFIDSNTRDIAVNVNPYQSLSNSINIALLKLLGEDQHMRYLGIPYLKFISQSVINSAELDFFIQKMVFSVNENMTETQYRYYGINEIISRYYQVDDKNNLIISINLRLNNNKLIYHTHAVNL